VRGESASTSAGELAAPCASRGKDVESVDVDVDASAAPLVP